MGEKKVGVTIKGQLEESLSGGNVLYLDYFNFNFLVVITYYLLQNATTIRGNWVNGAWDFSVLFLTIACEFVITSKQS